MLIYDDRGPRAGSSNWNVLSLGRCISFEVESQPTVNAKIALDVKGGTLKEV